MRKTIALFTIITCALVYACSVQAQLSVETLGVLRYDTKSYEKTWGAGADLGVKLNDFVTGHVRAVAYETDNWRGGAVDEVSALVEARLLQSANKAVSLSAIGGVDYAIASEAYGLSAGGRLAYSFSERFKAGIEARAQIMEGANVVLIPAAYLSLSF